jgi:TfoX/Sxy family transcriptional regulator of competence genes
LRDDDAMAYDEELAERLREQLAGCAGVSEKRMFGGLAFLIDGRLAVSASSRGGLLVRVEPARTAELVGEPHVRRFEMRGREMDGWLHVDADAVITDEQLARWAGLGVAYARSLAPA